MRPLESGRSTAVELRVRLQNLALWLVRQRGSVALGNVRVQRGYVMTQSIRITRRWVQIVSYRSSRFMWTYDYTFNSGRPPAVAIEYGTSLTEMRRMLRQNYPHLKIEMEWS